jgi:hypothetical protein
VCSSRNAWTTAAVTIAFGILPSSFILRRVFHSQPVEQRALDLPLACPDLDQARADSRPWHSAAD